MFFRRTREERAKLKEERRELEELKKSANVSQNQKTATAQENNESPKQPNKPKNSK